MRLEMGSKRISFAEPKLPKARSPRVVEAVHFLLIALVSIAAAYILLRWHGVRLF
jgi:hypothetical protein